MMNLTRLKLSRVYLKIWAALNKITCIAERQCRLFFVLLSFYYLAAIGSVSDHFNPASAKLLKAEDITLTDVG